MALPPTAKAFPQALGPSDLLDFYLVLYQGSADAKPAPLLLPGEGVASYVLALTPEAIAAGLEIHDTDLYTTTLIGNVLTLWTEVAEDVRGSRIFEGEGVTVGIEMFLTTTSVPPRRKLRTFLVRIANQ